MVVPCDTKSVIAPADRLEQALTAKVKKREVIFRLQILRGYAHAMNEHASSPPKIAHPFESRVPSSLFMRPLVEPGSLNQRVKVATLNRRIAHQHFRRTRKQRCFGGSANQRSMRHQAIKSARILVARIFVLMENHIWLDQHARARRNHFAEWTTLISPAKRIRQSAECL